MKVNLYWLLFIMIIVQYNVIYFSIESTITIISDY